MMFFFFNDTATTEIYTLSLHDALPILAMVTMLGAAGGILGAYVMTVAKQRTVDIGMVCNGLIAGLVAITAPSGYVENWAAPVIGIVGGLIVVPSILLIYRKLAPRRRGGGLCRQGSAPRAPP